MVEVERQTRELVRCRVKVVGPCSDGPNDKKDKLEPALCYPGLTGLVTEGDEVFINTTARDLGLGTGGFHFVVWTPRMACHQTARDGHIMKLRYTPWQMSVTAVEEQDSPHHHQLGSRTSIKGLPVVCCELHSQLIPVVAGIRSISPDYQVVYIMTDGGALPVQFSETVQQLTADAWLSGTVSAGHSFGGALEAVNVYSALAAARWVDEADVAVVGIGPGVVGTATALGHTGMQQAQAANAVTSLDGQPVLPLRISRRDDRSRHRGISHHTRTVLTQGALGPVSVIMARESAGDWQLWRQLYREKMTRRHRLILERGEPGMKVLRSADKHLRDLLMFMGRGTNLEPDYFLSAAAAGRWAALHTGGRKDGEQYGGD